MFSCLVRSFQRKKGHISLKWKIRGSTKKHWNILPYLASDSLEIIKKEVSYDPKSFHYYTNSKNDITVRFTT